MSLSRKLTLHGQAVLDLVRKSYMKIHVKIQVSPRLSVAQKPCLLSKAFITHFLAIGRVANRVIIRLYLPGSAALSGMLSSSIVSLTSLRIFTHKTAHYLKEKY